VAGGVAIGCVVLRRPKRNSCRFGRTGSFFFSFSLSGIENTTCGAQKYGLTAFLLLAERSFGHGKETIQVLKVSPALEESFDCAHFRTSFCCFPQKVWI
jgi:hypothetical protein